MIVERISAPLTMASTTLWNTHNQSNNARIHTNIEAYMNQHTNIKILISWFQKGMSKRRKSASGYSQQVDGGQPTSGRFPTQLPDSRRTHAATQIISYQILHSLFRTFLRLRCCCCCRCRFLRASFCFVGLLLRLSALSIAIRPSTEV